MTVASEILKFEQADIRQEAAVGPSPGVQVGLADSLKDFEKDEAVRRIIRGRVMGVLEEILENELDSLRLRRSAGRVG